MFDTVRDQYEKYPYPKVPWLGKISPISLSHKSFEVGSLLCHGKLHSHENKKILILGCGTTEPYEFSVLHPKTKLTAVDFSQKSLSQAKAKCLLHGRFNIDYVNKDLIDYSKQNPKDFDYIHCYGVLHHLSNPQIGFQSVANLLNENGFARIMVYSKANRFYIEQIQNALKLLGPLEPKDIRAYFKALPTDHPHRIVFELNLDSKSDSGLIDSYYHSCENSFDLESLKGILQLSGLEIVRWDFSINQINVLGPKLVDSLEFAEGLSQFPGQFVFWVRKRKTDTNLSTYYRNPFWSGQRKFFSGILKSNISLSPHQVSALETLKTPQPITKIEGLLSFEELSSLLNCRLVLGGL